MGRTYGVPRSAKGESRILYIFTVKSLAVTLAFAAVGWLISSLIKMVIEVSLIGNIIIIGAFGVIGFVIGAAKIPDTPMMGPLQKAGGEEILDILFRLFTFRNKKKLYIYGLTRKTKKETTQQADNKNIIKSLGIK